MSISFGSIITIFFLNIILILYLLIITEIEHIEFFKESKIIFIGLTIILIRLLLPLNFPFTITIPITHILPNLSRLYYMKIFNYPLFYILFMIWVIVALSKIINIVYKDLKLYRLLKQLSQINNEKELNVNILSSSGKNLNILTTSATISPVIVGLFHPTLIIPDYVFSLSREEIDYIIMHETAHYKKLDLWLKHLIKLVSCIYWWNPFIHILQKKMELTLELSTDLSVIHDLDNLKKLDYANCLIKVSKICHSSDFNNNILCDLGIPLISIKTDLEIRTNKIISATKKNKCKTKLLRYINITVALLMIVLCFLFVPEAYEAGDNTQEGSFSITKDNTYLIEKSNGYDLYYNGKYIITIDELDETLKKLKIYKE